MKKFQLTHPPDEEDTLIHVQIVMLVVWWGASRGGNVKIEDNTS